MGIIADNYGVEIETILKLWLSSILIELEFPESSYTLLPTLAFWFACLYKEDMNKLVTDIVEKISKI